MHGFCSCCPEGVTYCGVGGPGQNPSPHADSPYLQKSLEQGENLFLQQPTPDLPTDPLLSVYCPNA